MKISKIISVAIIFVAIMLASALLSSNLFAQAPSGALRGQVTDQSGAVVTQADVALTPASGTPLSTKTDAQGMYEFKGLAPGEYTLDVVAPGFTLYENTKVEIAAQPLRLNVPLAIEVQTQKVQVSDTAPTVDVNPESNAGAITISSKELEALPDDPDELLTDLQALAGPSAGPNGGQMYIDGFTAGQLPPKSSIREIRINQNPFSSEYDQLGYGRIEIFTKPGTDKLHGQFMVNGNDSAFNSSDPFAGPEPGYDSVQYNGNIGGALNKNGSFFVNVDRRVINALSAIDAVTLDPNLSPVSTLESIANPQQRLNIGPRLDYALSKNNTLTARYQYYRDTENNNGIGQNTLASQATNTIETESTFQIGDTQVYGSKVVNETRFQYLRDNSGTTSLDLNPEVNVLGAFTGGGNGTVSSDHQDHYELQNYTSVIHGNHTMKFGGRLRAIRDANSSTAGFNGIFTFSSLCSQDTFPSNSSCVNQAPGPGMYQYAEQLLQGGATTAPATQLIITQGSPIASVTMYDAGLYVQDDWRVKPNITFSYGFRFESQSDIRDHADLAPRLGIAWGVHGRSSPPIIVIRGGLGVFYNRFQESQILQADRLNGITQTQSVIDNPTCFPGLDKPLNTAISNCGAVSSSSSAIYQISPSLTAPYTLQGAISAERQLTKSATLSLTYLTSRGFDQFLTINANAPVPGTPCAPDCVEPAQNLYRYVSEGNFRQNQFIVNSNIRWGTRVQLFTYYTLNYANSDTSGVSSFPSNSYDISQDYGRATFDIRHRLFLGGSIAMKYGFRLSPFFVASSGSPINVTTATDLNGDSIFNDRPGLVSTATCPTVVPPGAGSTVYCTPLGTFDAMPTASEKLAPINFATSPSHVSLNFRLAKTFGFGPKVKGTGNLGGPGGPGGRGGGGRGGPLFGGGPQMGGPGSDRRYNLTLSSSVRNVFNKVNVGNPAGAWVLGSPFFDKYNSL
ncbi:MAG: carboxypeptidase regulatory-like domain-containing protein, partial [Candidatus Sulfotelmatobacter sp.]